MDCVFCRIVAKEIPPRFLPKLAPAILMSELPPDRRCGKWQTREIVSSRSFLRKSGTQETRQDLPDFYETRF